MKKRLAIICIVIAAILCLALSSCNSSETEPVNVNDKEYTISELVGTYFGEFNSNGTTYEYTLVISSNSTCKLDEKSYTYESSRAGIYWYNALGVGDVVLTKNNITIIRYNGYIKSGKIIITIYGKEVELVKKLH